VSVRPVNIGPTDGPMAAVNSGVSVGERVVVDGTDRLRDGARVIMPAAPSQAPAADPRRTRKILSRKIRRRMRSPKAPVIAVLLMAYFLTHPAHVVGVTLSNGCG
jgi:hypothetical protein